MSPPSTLAETFSAGLARQRQRLEQTPLSIRQGRLRKVSGLVLEVEGLPMAMGAHACVQNSTQGHWVDAECIVSGGRHLFDGL